MIFWRIKLLDKHDRPPDMRAPWRCRYGKKPEAPRPLVRPSLRYDIHVRPPLGQMRHHPIWSPLLSRWVSRTFSLHRREVTHYLEGGAGKEGLWGRIWWGEYAAFSIVLETARAKPVQHTHQGEGWEPRLLSQPTAIRSWYAWWSQNQGCANLRPTTVDPVKETMSTCANTEAMKLPYRSHCLRRNYCWIDSGKDVLNSFFYQHY